jgi:hypothetical protein
MEARLVMMEEAGRRLDARVVSALLVALDTHAGMASRSGRRMSLAG